MKINELKKIAEENDYELRSDLWQHSLKREGCDAYINISGKIENRIWVSIVTICDEKDFNMIKAAVEFAETPLEDREEEKKFYLKHKYFQAHLDSKQYFCIRTSGGYPILKGYPTNADKFEFTLKEIEDIKKKLGTDLADFELVEVEDEN